MSFWNKVKSGVSKAANEAEKQANIAKFNLQIGDVKTEVRRKICELGDAALTLCRDGSLTQPSLLAVYEEIKASEAKVRDLEAQLERAKAADDAAPDAEG